MITDWQKLPKFVVLMGFFYIQLGFVYLSVEIRIWL